MSETELTADKLVAALRFINSTASHIFLTGKAGTGKTTFLRSLSAATHKKFAVVAPTGVAALNAGGATIHSLFLLPFGSYYPGTHADPGLHGAFYTRQTLAKKHPLNSLRKKVLRSIDLLVVDEVSMVRADLLDALDYRLKAARGEFNKSFGGVQLLMIGDLFQLPPIIKDSEWETLRGFYASAHFFEAQALKKDGYVYIELDKIYRQSDDRFVGVLNNLRNNACTQADLQLLNSRYQRDAQAGEGVITLVTHNYQADQINQQEMAKIDGKSHKFKATIEGSFPENLYPLPLELELKTGAQVMFVKNDPAGNRFYNGKLAKVTNIDEGDITVELEGGGTLVLEQMLWKNIKYVLNEQTQAPEEKIEGTFTQYPVKPAWAITVHKSQGLTFEKAVVDVGQAFAPGQVYVALSRLVSLEGLVLRTPINTTVISNNSEVVRYTESKTSQPPLGRLLETGREAYLRDTLLATFNFGPLLRLTEAASQKTEGGLEFEDQDMQQALPLLQEKIAGEQANTQKFQAQLARLLHEKQHASLIERVEKGSQYYLEFLYGCLRDLLVHAAQVGTLTRVKTYLSLLEELDQLLMQAIAALQKAGPLARAVLAGTDYEKDEAAQKERNAKRQAMLEAAAEQLRNSPKTAKNKSGKKKKPTGATYQETYELIRSGLDMAQVAEKRGLALSTVESHVAKGIAEGEPGLGQTVSEADIASISALAETKPDMALSDMHTHLGGKVSHNTRKIVLALLKNSSA